MTMYTKPIPKINEDSRPFWEGCKAHELRFQKCNRCGHVRWPAAIICPHCHGSDTAWITAAGRGKVYTYVVYHVAYHPGFKGEIPYVVAIVELDEGPHLYTNIIECSPGEVSCNMNVEVVWDDVTAELTLPKFRPVIS
jgi:uncharacterized OB-fold protein